MIRERAWLRGQRESPSWPTTRIHTNKFRGDQMAKVAADNDHVRDRAEACDRVHCRNQARRVDALIALAIYAGLPATATGAITAENAKVVRER